MRLRDAARAASRAGRKEHHHVMQRKLQTLLVDVLGAENIEDVQYMSQPDHDDGFFIAVVDGMLFTELHNDLQIWLGGAGSQAYRNIASLSDVYPLVGKATEAVAAGGSFLALFEPCNPPPPPPIPDEPAQTPEED